MAVKYTVVIRNLDNDGSGTQRGYGKGTVRAEFENATNVGWTEYMNDVGEAFFSISQDDPKIAVMRDLTTDDGSLNGMHHMEIYRNYELVWAGWLGEADETHEDVIFYGYSYLSGLYSLLSDWDQEWNATDVHTIFSELWTRATTTLTYSRMNWMTTGTIESLWTTSGGPTTLQIPFYNIFKKRILLAFKELAAYAISDTTNNVSFEITPAGVFNLYQNRGNSSPTNNTLFNTENGGKVRSYRRISTPVDRRTVIYAVGSSPNDVDLQNEVSIPTGGTSGIDTLGRLEEPIYLQWVRDATELSRVSNTRLQRAEDAAGGTDLFITLYPDSVIPYRATGAEYELGDTFLIWLKRGLSANDIISKIVVGQQVMYSRGAENVRVLFGSKL